MKEKGLKNRNERKALINDSDKLRMSDWVLAGLMLVGVAALAVVLWHGVSALLWYAQSVGMKV